jgi:hypothetical protein
MGSLKGKKSAKTAGMSFPAFFCLESGGWTKKEMSER